MDRFIRFSKKLNTGDVSSRFVSWNFKSVLSDCETMEFRRPPQVVGATSTCHWIAFSLSFASYAFSCDFTELTSASEHANFKECIRKSAKNLCIKEALSDWHEMAQTRQTSILSPEEAARITRKKRERRSLFVEIVC